MEESSPNERIFTSDNEAREPGNSKDDITVHTYYESNKIDELQVTMDETVKDAVVDITTYRNQESNECEVLEGDDSKNTERSSTFEYKHAEREMTSLDRLMALTAGLGS